ncbi:uncharacterized protein TM35_000045390 [Trypanosoma theileri]|uniref:Uncharacterized protein n=1 Tax=Trypanosoma theileri TaxID=67003 RepID=A0A1X0P620_9TRYP|nr:uncharacterized protein TM35_000045390 [Trypanosoma theileri]ORC92325.1 hypothetical protein TM35_000045390 [Trypanosoma theileri]
MGCESCEGGGCRHCCCTQCGATVESGNIRVFRCTQCRSPTHATCASLEDQPLFPQFFCSTICRFGITLNRNCAFNVPLSARLEVKCDQLWQEMSATDATSYCRLRCRMWAEYFEREKHLLPMVPRHYDFPSDVRLRLVELLSPEGQADLLCTLHPLDHPVGSVVALPAQRVWQTPRVRPGSSSSYVAEAAEKLCHKPQGVVTPRQRSGTPRVGQKRGRS